MYLVLFRAAFVESRMRNTLSKGMYVNDLFINKLIILVKYIN